MGLIATQPCQVEEQFGGEAISDIHPLTPRLRQMFGDHTFILDAAGLNIVEPAWAPESSNGNVVKLASWPEDHPFLNGHEPQLLRISADLGPGETKFNA